MSNAKCLGIWMDHSNAHLIEFTEEPTEIKTVSSKFTRQEKEECIGKSEQVMHNKEQHEEHDYYKKIGDVIRNYEDVLLFGPTQAKLELLNLLRADHHFTNIKIEIQQADKMTDNQQHAFVKAHFSKHHFRLHNQHNV
jgi:hypothetical protein